MNRKCVAKECSDKGTFICNCLQKDEFFCKNHGMKHIKTGGEHTLTSLKVKLNESENQRFMEKSQQIIESLENLRKDLLENAYNLISKATTELQLSLIRISDKKNNIKMHLSKIIQKKSIDKLFYEELFIIDVKKFNFNAKNAISDKIVSIFHVDFDNKNSRVPYRSYKKISRLVSKENKEQVSNNSECNKLFFSKHESKRMLSIDLNRLIVSPLNYFPKEGCGCCALNLDKENYFFYGNMGDKEAYIINTKQESYAELPRGLTKAYCGSLLKNNKIYIFSEVSCDTFDLQLKEWKSIGKLPNRSMSITTTLLNNEIIFSGFQLGSLYSYNEKAFKKIFPLPPGECKLVCKGWIAISERILYENNKENESEWIAHNTNIKFITPLSVFTTYRKNQFIYFIDNSESLFRINIKYKILEVIAFKIQISK